MTTAEKLQHIGEKPMLALTREDILTCSFADIEILVQRAWDSGAEGAKLVDRLQQLGITNIFDRFTISERRELASAWDGVAIQAAQYRSS